MIASRQLVFTKVCHTDKVGCSLAGVDDFSPEELFQFSKSLNDIANIILAQRTELLKGFNNIQDYYVDKSNG